MHQPSDRVVRFGRDLVIFMIGVVGAVFQLFILPHPDQIALGAISLFLFGPAALQWGRVGGPPPPPEV